MCVLRGGGKTYVPEPHVYLSLYIYNSLCLPRFAPFISRFHPVHRQIDKQSEIAHSNNGKYVGCSIYVVQGSYSAHVIRYSRLVWGGRGWAGIVYICRDVRWVQGNICYTSTERSYGWTGEISLQSLNVNPQTLRNEISAHKTYVVSVLRTRITLHICVRTYFYYYY